MDPVPTVALADTNPAVGPAPGPVEPVRVAVVGRPTERIDLAEQLRQRLRYVAAAIAGAMAAGLALRLVLNRDVWADPARGWAERFNTLSSYAGLSVAQLAAVVWLRPAVRGRPPRPAEAWVFGWTAAFLMQNQVGLIVLDRADLAADPITHSLAHALPWALLIVTYGVLIPNTGRRCAAALGLLAAATLVEAAAGFALAPQPARVVGLYTVQKSVWLAMACAVVVYGAYRIEALREAADRGRELGQYRLGRRLGAGGMGEVYLAEHRLLKRPCAVKLIRPERAGDPEHLRRFEREVQATATLTHPNAVQVYDYGRTADGTFYAVMEYLPGLTLDQLVAAAGPLPPGRAVHLLLQAAAALQEAHAIGLLHRDVKPGNVMVCDRGGRPDAVKLLDFGLVLPLGDSGAALLTREGAIAGTPAYMAPEQADGGRPLDARTDVYGVGAVGYFLLTGRPPFGDRSVGQTLVAVLGEPPDPPSRWRPGLPADLDAVVLRCLAKKPDDRYESVTALMAALAGVAAATAWTAGEASAWWREHAGSAGPAEPAGGRTRSLGG